MNKFKCGPLAAGILGFVLGLVVAKVIGCCLAGRACCSQDGGCCGDEADCCCDGSETSSQGCCCGDAADSPSDGEAEAPAE